MLRPLARRTIVGLLSPAYFVPQPAQVLRSETGRFMDQHQANSTGASPITSENATAPMHAASTLRQQKSFLLAVILLAPLSAAAGFFAAHFQGQITNWLKIHSVAAANSRGAATALISAPQPTAKDLDAEQISRLAPQQQAERLLELSIQRPDLSVSLIQRNLTSWRGHLEDTDHLFHLVLAALKSDDPRVRVAAVEIDLAANNLMKSPESVEKLQRQIQSASGDRYLALWRLGALGNRGVEPSVILGTLRLYA